MNLIQSIIYLKSLFENIFQQFLNPHAHMKKKIKRFNNNPYSKKRLYNAIMCRSRLKSVSNKTHTSFIYVFTKTHQRDCVLKLRDNRIFKALL